MAFDGKETPGKPMWTLLVVSLRYRPQPRDPVAESEMTAGKGTLARHPLLATRPQTP